MERILSTTVPELTVTKVLKDKINLAFRNAGSAIKSSIYSKSVKNPVAQYAANRRVTGRVIIATPINKKSVTVELCDYWPSYTYVDGIRQYSKHESARVVSMLATGAWLYPEREVLEHLAFCAIGIATSRKATPREALIKSHVMTALEESGFHVLSVETSSGLIDRNALDDSINSMEEIFNAMIKIGGYNLKEGKREVT
jgi:hypothetical protein